MKKDEIQILELPELILEMDRKQKKFMKEIEEEIWKSMAIPKELMRGKSIQEPSRMTAEARRNRFRDNFYGIL